MLDLNKTMFFKAKFDVACAEQEDLLWIILMQIRGWMMAKSRRDGYEFPEDIESWTALKRGALLKSVDARVQLYSCAHFEKGRIHSWACCLTEDFEPPKGEAPRQWVTEIGFVSSSTNNGVLSMVLSYCDGQGYIGSLQDEPPRTIPWIVRYIMEDPEIECSLSGIDLSSTMFRINDENALMWYRRIIQSDRAIPIIYLPLRQSSEARIDPERLSDVLGPNAIVLYSDQPNTTQLFNNLLRQHDLHCYAGGLRVFVAKPDVANPLEKTRHRFIAYRDVMSQGPEWVYETLRRALAQDINFWESMLRVEDVKQLNREADHEKRIAGMKERFQDEALEEMLAAEQRAVAAERDKGVVELDYKELARKYHEMEARCASYQDALAKRGDTVSRHQLTETIEAMAEMPPTNQQIADLIVAMYPNLIDFTQNGWDSLQRCTTSPRVFREALSDMCLKLRPLFLPSFRGDVEAEFNSRSHFIYARGEGAMTHKDKKLMAQRWDTYEGRELKIEKHIKSSTGDPAAPGFLRIYFEWDAASEKLVISDCGGHKEIYMTKKQK